MSQEAVNQFIAKLGTAIGANSGLGGTIKIDLGPSGSIFIDGRSTPNAVTSGEGKNADTTLTASYETFEKIFKRELDPTSAFMQGKLKVAGDMGLAMKLGPIVQKFA
jgi:putative sterol carrier protein